jgi:acyl-CoA synthetase (AMP-forming)/AMP-acid ligase II
MRALPISRLSPVQLRWNEIPASGQVERILSRLVGSQQPAFLTPRATVTWHDWSSSVRRLREEYSGLSRCTLGLLCHPTPTSYAVFAALACLDCHAMLLDEDLDAARLQAIARTHAIAALIESGDDGSDTSVQVRPLLESPQREGHGEVTIFTSGSTGEPKPVRHDWTTLTRPVRLACEASSQTWLLTFRPHLYAGVQVFLHCLLNQGTLVIPERGMGVEAVAGLMRRHAVSHVSATPSYWRRLITLGGERFRGLPIKQITLGGEPCNEHLLDTLSGLFPAARLVHIYATSELGRCFSVRDGRAGFPAAYLVKPTGEGVELRVEDGELFVRPANAMLEIAAGEDRWIATGDLIEQVDDRYQFVGRRSDLINVGGNKVHPHRVEAVVQDVTGVADVRVYARSSSLVGQMVACEFVVTAGDDPEAVKRRIIEECRQRLAAHERPRFLDSVPSIALSQAGKKVRRPE